MAVPCRLTTRVPLWARREGPSCSPWYDLSLLPSCKSGCLHLFLQVKWGPVYTLYSDYNVVILYDGTFVEVNTSHQHQEHPHQNDDQVIPAPWVKGQHCGVCGNFDGNTKNEMVDKVANLTTMMIIILNDDLRKHNE